MMLRGMGFDNNTAIYIAAGKIYRAEKYMMPLKEMFPLLQSKETLASPEELDPLKVHIFFLLDYCFLQCKLSLKFYYLPRM
jgi:hypothetical protein